MREDRLPIVDYRSRRAEDVPTSTWVGIASMIVILLVATAIGSVAAYAALMWVVRP